MSCKARTTCSHSRRQKLVARFLQRVMPRELAREFNLSVELVYSELTAEFKQRERELQLAEQFASQQYHAQLLRIESAAWEAWESSKNRPPRQVVKVVQDAKGERRETTTTTHDAGPDPRYLSLVMSCLERRVAWREILGSQTSSDFQPWRNPEDELRKIIAEARARQAECDAVDRQAAEIDRLLDERDQSQKQA